MLSFCILFTPKKQPKRQNQPPTSSGHFLKSPWEHLNLSAPPISAEIHLAPRARPALRTANNPWLFTSKAWGKSTQVPTKQIRAAMEKNLWTPEKKMSLLTLDTETCALLLSVVSSWRSLSDSDCNEVALHLFTPSKRLKHFICKNRFWNISDVWTHLASKTCRYDLKSSFPNAAFISWFWASASMKEMHRGKLKGWPRHQFLRFTEWFHSSIDTKLWATVLKLWTNIRLNHTTNYWPPNWKYACQFSSHPKKDGQSVVFRTRKISEKSTYVVFPCFSTKLKKHHCEPVET